MKDIKVSKFYVQLAKKTLVWVSKKPRADLCWFYSFNGFSIFVYVCVYGAAHERKIHISMQTMVCNLNWFVLAAHQLTTADKTKPNETKTLLFDATATAARVSLLPWKRNETGRERFFRSFLLLFSFQVCCIAHFPFPSVQLHLCVSPKMHQCKVAGVLTLCTAQHRHNWNIV